MDNQEKGIGWGILGCGGIAGKFADSLEVVKHGALVACASRTPARAAAFAEKYGARRSFDAYEALVASPEVDAVYIATTHNFHHDNICLALEAGKAVPSKSRRSMKLWLRAGWSTRSCHTGRP
ncbi:MAG: Gfo/Idh/MocA family oxidoreductase [Verrucomicrobia bacterium]|jgi:predicted dehydrogenase|nr:Gfo/Idh/MocA family oxidoreductase [Verrucomicrobiota bacterium]